MQDLAASNLGSCGGLGGSQSKDLDGELNPPVHSPRWHLTRDVELVCAWVSYDAKEESELSLEGGDVVLVVERRENGMCLGVLVWKGIMPNPDPNLEVDLENYEEWMLREIPSLSFPLLS